MIAVNFAPRKYVRRIFLNIIIAKVALFGVLLAVVVITFSFFHYFKYRTLLAENELLSAEYARLNKEVELSKKLEIQISEVQKYIESIENLNRNRYTYVAFMQDLVNNLPSTVWFSAIETKTQNDSIDVRINVNSNNIEDLLWWYAFIENNKNRYYDAKINAINYSGDFYVTQISFKYRYSL